LTEHFTGARAAPRTVHSRIVTEMIECTVNKVVDAHRRRSGTLKGHSAVSL